MAIEPDNKELQNAALLIDAMVEIDCSDGRKVDLEFKLDVLERTIELLRIRHKAIKNNLSIEDFVRGDLFADRHGLRFMMISDKEYLGTGTPPVCLQPKLLLFLLLYHRKQYRVLDIIRYFVHRIWEELDTLDFKKTDTGVFRCYTNTRFAAKTLRDYGLLKFTRKEAYKTWVLSLPGFLVASLVLDDQNRWTIAKHRKVGNFDLHQDIWDMWSQMNSVEAYVRRLESICKPNADIFKTFNDVIEKSYELLKQYWKALSNPNMTIADRCQASASWIKQLDELPGGDDFYIELSKSINLDRFLNEV